MQIFFVAFLLLQAQLTIAALAVGDQLPPLEFHDQHDRVHTISDNVKLILFSSSRPASKLLQKALKNKEAEFLEQRGILTIADISEMPSVITRFIALPKMRRSAYPQLLGRTAEKTKLFPREPKKVTLLYLNQFKVIDIVMTDSLDVIQAALEENNKLEH